MRNLKELFEQAAELAQHVPDNMQASAFTCAIRLLSGESLSAETGSTLEKRAGATRKQRHRTRNDSPDESRRKTAKGGLTPKSAIAFLVDSGFFDGAQTARAAQDYLRQKRGYVVVMGDFTKQLLRAVRNGVLERDIGSDGQYLYKKPA